MRIHQHESFTFRIQCLGCIQSALGLQEFLRITLEADLSSYQQCWLPYIENDDMKHNEDKYDPVKQPVMYLKQKMGSVETRKPLVRQS